VISCSRRMLCSLGWRTRSIEEKEEKEEGNKNVDAVCEIAREKGGGICISP